MRDANDIVRERQKAIRREMDRRGILLKQVQLDGGWDTVSTVASYFPQDGQPATMSMAAFYRILETKALPADLLTLLLPPGFAIVEVPENVDYDEVSGACRAFLAAKDAAHHPGSENGRDIGPKEQAILDTRVVQLRGKVAA